MQLRILVSYHYYKNTDLDALFAKHFTKPYPDVFADSGAFSAMTQSVEIDWRDYAAWVKRWRHLFTAYANLDVIGNAEATWENQQRLENVGLKPVPVFHVGEDWSYLECMVKRYTYIALGGLVPHLRSTGRVMPWLVRAFKMARGRAVYHGFGVTSWTVLRSLPWYSVDSSTWTRGVRFGEVPLFDEKRGRFVRARLGDRRNCYRHAKLFRSLGYSPGDFADRSRNDRTEICAVSALSYMRAERWLQKLHGKIEIPQRQRHEDDDWGIKIYLVDTANVSQTARIWRY